MPTIKVDSKGRLTLPLKLRKELGVEPGATIFYERIGKTLRLAKAESPFDALAEHAIEEDRAGRTRSLREFAREQNIPLDGE